MFKDKVVLVTGASSGIGAGTAVAFSREGAKLIIGGRNEANLNKTAKSCEENGAEVLTVVGDLTKEECCNSIVDKAMERFGKLDVLVNNAGAPREGNIDKATISDVDAMLSIHVRSVFMLCKRAVPHLKTTKGAIVNVNSAFSAIPTAGFLAYGLSKAATSHFTKSLAQGLAPNGVRVNGIIPGVIDTPMFEKPGGALEGHSEKHEETIAQLGGIHPMGRCGTVEDCASLIVFLASEKSSFITGALVPVDGGLIGKNSFSTFT